MNDQSCIPADPERLMFLAIRVVREHCRREELMAGSSPLRVGLVSSLVQVVSKAQPAMALAARLYAEYADAVRRGGQALGLCPDRPYGFQSQETGIQLLEEVLRTLRQHSADSGHDERLFGFHSEDLTSPPELLERRSRSTGDAPGKSSDLLWPSLSLGQVTAPEPEWQDLFTCNPTPPHPNVLD